MYSEIGRSLVRDALRPEGLMDSSFIDAVNRTDSDGRDWFFPQAFPSYTGTLDFADVKTHIKDFQDIFAKGFAYYSIPEYKTALQIYAPGIYEYFKNLDWEQLKGYLKNEPLDFQDNTDKALEWAQENYGDWYNKLNPLLQTAITGYLRQDYKTINPYLWNAYPEKEIDTELERKIQNIQQALYSNPLPEDLIVYRRMGATEYDLTVGDPAYDFNKPENVAVFKEKWEGKEKENLGFLSTTLLNNGAGQMAPRKLILRLQVPKGTHGAYVNFTDAQYGGEYEFLLSNGYKYKINKISEVKEGSQTKLLIDATLIPQK